MRAVRRMVPVAAVALASAAAAGCLTVAALGAGHEHTEAPGGRLVDYPAPVLLSQPVPLDRFVCLPTASGARGRG